MTADWQTTYYPQDSDVPHAEWVEKIEREAKWFFERSTGPQRAVYHQALRDQMPYLRCPKAERARADALRKFRADTADAAALFEETCIELARDGEVSEAMSERWTELMKPQMAEAAE